MWNEITVGTYHVSKKEGQKLSDSENEKLFLIWLKVLLQITKNNLIYEDRFFNSGQQEID